VVFVADSQQNKLREDLASLQELARNVVDQGKRFQDFPLVLQYNKRDVPNALKTEILDHYLNSTIKVPRFEAVASKGIGVFDTLKAISKLVISKL